MRVGIVGGGINGLCAAWQLALSGHDVSLFERGSLLGETSSSSSKLLHGGLRYLENFEFRLVKEALKERSWWIEHVPQHTSALQFCLPIYDDSRRSFWKVKLGLTLYDWLAGSGNIGRHKYVSKDLMANQFSALKQGGLKHGFTFFDGQMDERKLGEWVVDQAKKSGVQCRVDTEVVSIDEEGILNLSNHSEMFDKIINLAGPWAEDLNCKSGMQSAYTLDLVRGSHLILERSCDCGYLLEVPGERRVFFVLPYDGNTLLGTTEVRQSLDEPIQCSADEQRYLLNAYNHYFVHQADKGDVVNTFSGIRPLIKSAKDPGRATREYAIERNGKVLTVFGGKWTTARALARKIVTEVNSALH